jgi:cytochrome c biogenesis protein CcmG/thiol:disulfide interchange protein DsbE
MTDPVPALPRRVNLWIFAPLVVFAVLAVLFAIRLQDGDPSRLPSTLIGKEAPQTTLAALPQSNLPGWSSSDFAGKVTLVNIFASWCIPCLDEHPQITTLSKDSRIRLIGLNYKDQDDNARRFLLQNGNPYAAIGVDAKGRAGIEWGVYGVPETFIIDRNGRIAYKFVGPIMPDALDKIIRPQIDKALSGN